MTISDYIGLFFFLAGLVIGGWCLFDYHMKRGDEQWMLESKNDGALTYDHSGHTMCIVDDLPDTTKKDLDDLARGTKL
jgi:hypothetical protein